MKQSQIRCWKSYCSEPLDKIEHYEEALAENFKGWCMHHRLEIQPDGKIVSMQELKDKGLYYDRPASELIFMRNGEHSYLHNKDKHPSAETRKKIAESKRGENNPRAMLGKHHSEETRQKISEALKGMTLSEEHRKKLSESCRGENNPFFGKHWWNNGISNKSSRECPGEGWTRGRLRFK